MRDERPRPRHPGLARHLRASYTPAQVEALAAQLRDFGVFDFRPLANGLYPAVHGELRARTGYQRTWVRDTVHVATVAWEAGQLGATRRSAESLLDWFEVQRPRLLAAIEGRADLDDKMQRPHVRFDGATLEELPEPWPHKQNDALGYALWFLARALLAGLTPVTPARLATLALFPRYFEALRYWEDLDSGHWEETPKLSSSSVGTVVAGLEVWARLRAARGPPAGLEGDLARVRELVSRGRAVLAATLPWETRGELARVGPSRRADAALLFLIHPLRVLDREQADVVLQLVRDELVGEHGVRRYVGDSYWMADYKQLFDEDTRTSGFEDDVGARDRHLRPGSEAQWCLFDPLLSTIHGWRYLASGEAADRALQIHHLQRALAQLTGPGHPAGEGACPEAYYLEDSARGEWVANDNTPLLWTQALLASALLALERTAGRDAG